MGTAARRDWSDRRNRHSVSSWRRLKLRQAGACRRPSPLRAFPSTSSFLLLSFLKKKSTTKFPSWLPLSLVSSQTASATIHGPLVNNKPLLAVLARVQSHLGPFLLPSITTHPQVSPITLKTLKVLSYHSTLIMSSQTQSPL